MYIYDTYIVYIVSNHKGDEKIMTDNEIMLNGKVIGKVFIDVNDNVEFWTSHGLIMQALEKSTGNIEYTH